MSRAPMLFLAAAVSFAPPAHGQQPDWQNQLDRQLPRLGHRNWIVVADAAYPSQTAPGIKMIATGEKQLDVVRAVLAAIEKAKHVRGAVFVDSELPYVPEKFAEGIGRYRAELREVLKGQRVTSLPHSEIIDKLDEAGQTFHVLLLKSDLALPYTSVFIRLECGYWSAEAEKELRVAIESAGK